MGRARSKPGDLKSRRWESDTEGMTNTKRIAALTVTALALLAPTAQASPHPYGRGDALTAIHAAQPRPYERDHMSSQRIARIVHHVRMVPRPGSDGTNRLCRSNSKARRIAC